jgi:hypothetical protein
MIWFLDGIQFPNDSKSFNIDIVYPLHIFTHIIAKIHGTTHCILGHFMNTLISWPTNGYHNTHKHVFPYSLRGWSHWPVQTRSVDISGCNSVKSGGPTSIISEHNPNSFTTATQRKVWYFRDMGEVIETWKRMWNVIPGGLWHWKYYINVWQEYKNDTMKHTM